MNEHTISLIFFPLHDSDSANIWKISIPGNKVIKNMTMFGSWVRPGSFMNIVLMNNGVAKNEIEFNTELKKTETISSHFAQTISP